MIELIKKCKTLVEESLLNRDFPIMFFTAVACMPIFWTKGKISRGEGGFLLGLYMLYLADKIIPLTFPLLYSGYKELVFLVLTIASIIIIYKTIIYWFQIKNLTIRYK